MFDTLRGAQGFSPSGTECNNSRSFPKIQDVKRNRAECWQDTYMSGAHLYGYCRTKVISSTVINRLHGDCREGLSGYCGLNALIFWTRVFLSEPEKSSTWKTRKVRKEIFGTRVVNTAAEFCVKKRIVCETNDQLSFKTVFLAKEQNKNPWFNFLTLTFTPLM